MRKIHTDREETVILHEYESTNKTQLKLAEEYGVSQPTISNDIKNAKNKEQNNQLKDDVIKLQRENIELKDTNISLLGQLLMEKLSKNTPVLSNKKRYSNK